MHSAITGKCFISNNLRCIFLKMKTRFKPILSASMSRIYRHIYSGAPVAMISADRYNNSRKVKEEWRRELRVDINRRGFSYITLAGAWNSGGNVSDEMSFFVIGIDRDTGEPVSYDELKDFAMECCEKYEQECVITGVVFGEKIRFELINKDGDVYSVFSAIKFDTPEAMEKLHKRYIKYREEREENFNPETDDYGFGYTRKRKNNNSFAMLNEDEAKLNALKSNFVDILDDVDKYTGLTASERRAIKSCLKRLQVIR